MHTLHQLSGGNNQWSPHVWPPLSCVHLSIWATRLSSSTTKFSRQGGSLREATVREGRRTMKRTKRKIRTALASTCGRRRRRCHWAKAVPLTDSQHRDTPLAGLTYCVSISAQVSRHWLCTKGVVYLLAEQLSSQETMKETIERCPCPCL